MICNEEVVKPPEKEYCCVENPANGIVPVCQENTQVECTGANNIDGQVTEFYGNDATCGNAVVRQTCKPAGAVQKVYCNPNAKKNDPAATYCKLANANPDPKAFYQMEWVDGADPGALQTCENTCGRHYCVFQDGDSQNARADGITYFEGLTAELARPNGALKGSVVRVEQYEYPQVFGDAKVLAFKVTLTGKDNVTKIEVVYAFDGLDWVWGLEAYPESWAYVSEGAWPKAEVDREPAYGNFNKIAADLAARSNFLAAQCLSYPIDHVAFTPEQTANLCTQRRKGQPNVHTATYVWEDGLSYDRLSQPYCPKEDLNVAKARIGQAGFNFDLFLWGTIAVEGPLDDKGFADFGQCDVACAGRREVAGLPAANPNLNADPVRPPIDQLRNNPLVNPPFRGPNPIQPYGPPPPSSLPGRNSSVTGTPGPQPPRPSSAGGGIPTSSSRGGTPPRSSAPGGANSSGAAARSSSPGAASSPGGFNQCAAGGSCTVRVSGNQCLQVPVDCRAGYTLQCSGTCGTDSCRGQCCRCAAGGASSAGSARSAASAASVRSSGASSRASAANSSGRSANSSGRSANSSGASANSSARSASANSSARSANSSGRSANSSGRSANSSGASANSSGRSANSSGASSRSSGASSANSSGRSAASSGQSSFGFQSSYAFSGGSSYGSDSSYGFDSSYGTISSARTGQASSMDEYCRLFPSRCSSAGSVTSAGRSDARLTIVCGNGINEPGEQCDDGNRSNADGCDNNCRLIASPLCRNGVVNPGEQCDDGNAIDGDGCDSNCTLTPVCGNRIVEYGERCDDGNRENGDGCDASCQPENTVGSQVFDMPGTTPGTVPGGTNPDVTPIATSRPPAGNTGPAAVAVMAAGAATGWAWMRRRRK